MRLTIEINGERHTVDLSDEVAEALDSIAQRNGLSFEQAIAQAVVNEKLLEDQVDSGGELLVKTGDKFHHLEYA